MRPEKEVNSRIPLNFDQSDLWMLVGVDFHFLENDPLGFLKYEEREPGCVPGLFKAYRTMLSMPDIKFMDVNVEPADIAIGVEGRVKMYHAALSSKATGFNNNHTSGEFRDEPTSFGLELTPTKDYPYPSATVAGVQHLKDRQYVRGPQRQLEIEPFYRADFKQIYQLIYGKDNLSEIFKLLVERLTEDLRSTIEQDKKLAYIAEFIQDAMVLHPFGDANVRALVAMLLNDILYSVGESPVVLVDLNVFDATDIPTLVTKIKEGQQIYQSIISKKDIRPHQATLQNMLSSDSAANILGIAAGAGEFALLNEIQSQLTVEKFQELLWGGNGGILPLQQAVIQNQKSMALELLRIMQLPSDYYELLGKLFEKSDVVNFARVDEGGFVVYANKFNELKRVFSKIYEAHDDIEKNKLHLLLLKLNSQPITSKFDEMYSAMVSMLSSVFYGDALKFRMFNSKSVSFTVVVGLYKVFNVDPEKSLITKLLMDKIRKNEFDSFGVNLERSQVLPKEIFYPIYLAELYSAKTKSDNYGYFERLIYPLIKSGDIELLLELIQVKQTVPMWMDITFFKGFLKNVDSTKENYAQDIARLTEYILQDKDYLHENIASLYEVKVMFEIFPTLKEQIYNRIIADDKWLKVICKSSSNIKDFCSMYTDKRVELFEVFKEGFNNRFNHIFDLIDLIEAFPENKGQIYNMIISDKKWLEKICESSYDVKEFCAIFEGKESEVFNLLQGNIRLFCINVRNLTYLVATFPQYNNQLFDFALTAQLFANINSIADIKSTLEFFPGKKQDIFDQLCGSSNFQKLLASNHEEMKSLFNEILPQKIARSQSEYDVGSVKKPLIDRDDESNKPTMSRLYKFFKSKKSPQTESHTAKSKNHRKPTSKPQ